MGLWSSLKSGVSKFGKTIASGVKKAGKWAWDNREGIGKFIGAGLDMANTLGVPGTGIASKVVNRVAKTAKDFGDDKFSKGFDLTKPKDKKLNFGGNDSQDLKSGGDLGGYSLNVKSSGGTRIGSIFNSYKSHR